MGHRNLFARAASGLVLIAAGLPLSASSQGRSASPPAQTCGSTAPAKQGWTGGVLPPAPQKTPHVFRLSDCYPATAANEPTQPWEAIDPKKDPEGFLWAVLAYFYEGNLQPSVEDSFDMDRNTVRRWYNAPWLDVGGNGREGVHGLTRERTSCPGELGDSHLQHWDNYAVGFYNAKGGQAVGQMWAGRDKPNIRNVRMPIGTVAAKLLFTTADESEIPYLKGAPVWQAYIYEDVHNPLAVADPTAKRRLLPVRLLQVDLAVRTKHAEGTTGWVFGTFVYGGGGKSGKETSGWRNLTPLGLMWGNDITKNEQWLNAKIEKDHHLGWKRRLNGPVDNPNSSCMSCHASAEYPLRAIAPKDEAAVTAEGWFRNVPAGEPFRKGSTSLDYSLQLAFGVENHRWVTNNLEEFQPPPFCPVWLPSGGKAAGRAK